MKVLTQRRDEIVNIENFYAIVQKGVMIGCVFDPVSPSIYELGTYGTMDRAREVLMELFSIEGEHPYTMPTE